MFNIPGKAESNCGKLLRRPMMQRVSKQEMVERLEAILGVPVGIKGLNTLLYGWKKKRHFGATYCQVLTNRDWMYITEVMDLSQYAGVDLTKK